MYQDINPEAPLGYNLPPFLPSMAIASSLPTNTMQKSLDN
jgi:hypothetical protein